MEELKTEIENVDVEEMVNMLSNKKKPKKSKVSQHDRTKFLSMLANINTMNEQPKDNSSLNEEQAKALHKEELKKKLRAKQNMLKQSRTSKTILQSRVDQAMKQFQDNIIPQPTISPIEAKMEEPKVEELDDYIN